jgi:hypothetical protein
MNIYLGKIISTSSLQHSLPITQLYGDAIQFKLCEPNAELLPTFRIIKVMQLLQNVYSQLLERWRLGGLQFEASIGKKLARPHLNQLAGGVSLLSQLCGRP